MPIPKTVVKKMNDLVEKGETIASLAKKYAKYDYWDIYWAVDDLSILGRKRIISNRLKKLVGGKLTKVERLQLINEIKESLDSIYDRTKKNSRKLVEIGKVLAK